MNIDARIAHMARQRPPKHLAAMLKSPKVRGRILCHVVDLDNGETLRVPASTRPLRGVKAGERCYVKANGRVAFGKPGKGVYRGVWWAAPDQVRRAA